ncbi:MAG: hypothetical protein AB8G22_20320 [Saprospiraceae bacterium]
MNQLTWTFVDDFGKRNVVGVGHSAESGNLVIYCNSNIILIDFKILEDYDYSFFIGDELVNFSIQKEAASKFSYSCEINKKADTPRNRFRKKEDKKHWKQVLALVGGLITFVLLCSFGAIYLNQKATYQDSTTLLANAGRVGVVRIVADYEKQELIHQYVANGKPFSKKIALTSTSPITFENGLLLDKEASFQIKYLPANPYLYEVNYSRPADNYLKKLLTQAVELQTQLHPNRPMDYHKCLVELAYYQQQLSGIITILNQQQNATTYRRLIKGVTFQNALAKRCW